MSDLLASDIQFLDPLNCGSTIGWYVSTRTSYGQENKVVAEGTVVLSDCSRKIEWSFDREDTFNQNVEKIDKAIDMLMAFRRSLLSANKEADKASKLLQKMNPKTEK